MLGQAHGRSSADVYPSPIRNRPVASQRRQNVFRQRVVVPSATPAVHAVWAGNAVSQGQLLPFRDRLYLASTPPRLPLRAGKWPPGSIRHAVAIKPQELLMTCPQQHWCPPPAPPPCPGLLISAHIAEFPMPMPLAVASETQQKPGLPCRQAMSQTLWPSIRRLSHEEEP
jgi:hypothetical protein